MLSELSNLGHTGNWTNGRLHEGENDVKSARPASCDVLHELHELVGKPGLRALHDHAEMAGLALSKSTAGNLLDGTTSPRKSSVEAFVHACLRYARSRRTPLSPTSESPGYWLERYRSATHTPANVSRSWPTPPKDAGYRLEDFGLPARRPASYLHAPSYLLDCRFEVVPFRDRGEQQILEDWLNDPTPRTSVQLVHGDGGQGKTRLAMQVARRAAEHGWHVVQAVDRPGPSRRGSRADSGKLLVVMDYAERWTSDALERIIMDLADDVDVQYLRVLMLARLDLGLWGLVTSTLDRHVDHLAEPVRLEGFPADDLEVSTAFDTAVSAFQSALQLKQKALLPPFRLKTASTSPLGLHMTALAAVWAHENRQPIPPNADLSTFLLTHERKYWSTGVSTGLPVVTASVQVGLISRTVLVATLFGSLTDSAMARRLLRTARLVDSDAEAQSLIDQHAHLYPNPVTLTGGPAAISYLRPLHPDRFAEDFVASCLREPSDWAFIRDLVQDVISRDQKKLNKRVLTFLSTVALRHDFVDKLLDELLGEPDPQAYVHVNSKGLSYYLHRTSAKMVGDDEPRTIYFFARLRRNLSGIPTQLPADRTVKENPRNGFLTISKKK